MNYDFPYIQHIDDVLPHVENREEFAVVTKGEGLGAYVVINYIMMTSDTFRPFTGEDDIGNAIRRECRGIIFDVNGNVIRRPFHKFFNLDEREETLIDNINFNDIVAIHQKLDGSMIAPFKTADGVMRFGTKMGETDIALQAANFATLPENSRLLKFCIDCMKANITPIFEWCSRGNRVVIDHPEDHLVLLAVRENTPGRYYKKEWLQMWADTYGLELVGEQNTSFASFDDLVDHTRGLIGEEGYVVELRGGHRVKTKGSWYLAIHKAKEKLLYERYVIEMILDEQTDDVLPFLLDSDKQRLIDYQDAFHEWATKSMGSIAAHTYHNIHPDFDGMSRKDWAINESKKFEPFHSVVFANWDKVPALTVQEWAHLLFDDMVKVIRNNCNSNSKLAEFKTRSGFSYVW